MWPLIFQFIRSNIAYVALPFAAVVGFVGYNAESWLRSPEAISSSKHNPKQTISEARIEQQMNMLRLLTCKKDTSRFQV
ncbi:unnamed protein product [Trichobilharzia szidati]|nr:unnamed protein product [Trichobilharzia szidati]